MVLAENRIPDIKKLTEILSGDPWVVSDTHFFHDRAFSDFEPVRRTFASSREDFDDKMIDVLRRSSPLLHLGDVTINSRKPDVMEERVRWVGERLRGVPRILVTGNHDRGSEAFYRETGWNVVSCGIDLTESAPYLYPDAPPFLLLDIGGSRVFFSHEPVLVERERTSHDSGIVETLGQWFVRLEAHLNIHGHTHSAIIPNPLFRNVSVESRGFAPVRVSNISDIYQKITVMPLP